MRWIANHLASIAAAIAGGGIVFVIITEPSKFAHPSSVSWLLSSIVQAQAALIGLGFVGATFIRSRSWTASESLESALTIVRERLQDKREKSNVGYSMFATIRDNLLFTPEGVLLVEPTTVLDLSYVLRYAKTIFEERGAHDVTSLLEALGDKAPMTIDEFNRAYGRLDTPALIDKFYKVAWRFRDPPWMWQEFPILREFVEKYNSTLGADLAVVRRNKSSSRLYFVLLIVQTVGLLLATLMLALHDETVRISTAYYTVNSVVLTIFAFGVVLLTAYAEELLRDRS